MQRKVPVLKIERHLKIGSSTAMMRRRARSRLFWCHEYFLFILILISVVVAGGEEYE